MKRLLSFRRNVGVLAALSVSLILPLAANAELVSLKSLADGTTTLVTCGDKVFDNFAFTIEGSGGYSASGEQILVQPAPCPGDYGLQFVGPITAFAIGSGQSSWVKVNIAFDVTITDPTLQFKDIALFLHAVGTYSGGGGTASVKEEAFPIFDGVVGDKVGEAFVDMSNPPASQKKEVDLTPGAAPYTKLRITKEIYVTANTNGATAPNAYAIQQVGLVEQRFSQMAIPEPATFALLTLGALVLLPRRKLA